MKKGGICTLFFMLWCIVGLHAQSKTVTGTVTDNTNLPLPGVNILVVDGTTGAVTDVNGQYSIEVNAEDVLEFSYIGYIPQRVTVGNQTQIDLTMEDDSETLEEIVVIGYGTTTKSDLTGSVVSLREEELTKGAVTNLNQLLTGRAAGLQVFQNSSEPGGGMSINVRGISSINAGNQPLYVIDGLPIDNSNVIGGVGAGFPGSRNQRNPLNTLNPSDIQSIEVLKDASATAIYGARGANGVILITTKKGGAGRMRVNYNGYYGVQSVNNELDLLNPTEYQQVLNELIDAGATNASPSERVESISGNGTNWQQEVFQDAPVQDHNLSFRGGSENSSFYASLNYFNQEGVVISSGLQRLTARLNYEQKVTNSFNFGLNLTTSNVLDDFVPNGVVPNEGGGVLSAAFDFDPTLSIFDDNGNYSLSPFITKDNPLAIAYGKDAKTNTFRTLGTVFGEYYVLPELSVKINLGGDIASSRRDVFVDDRTQDGAAAGGIGTVIMGQQYNYLVEGTINYRKEFGESRLSALAGITTQEFFNKRLNASSRDFVSLTTGTNRLQSGDPLTFNIGTSSIPSRLLSYLARVNYTIKDKYLLTANFRADGSSKFGENNKFGYFPSFALGWRLIEEDFIQSMDLFDNLKLRGSWGQTGNQEIGNFNSLTTFVTGNNPLVLEDIQYTVANPSRLANPDLKWETTTQTNIGLDWGILRGRLSGSIDYFYRKTTDLLLALPVPPQTGFATQLTNIGSLENQGVEIVLSSQNFVGEFDWNTSFNASFIQNQILELGPIDRIVRGALQFTQQISILQPGSPINSYYGYEVAGVWQQDDDFDAITDNVQPGDTKFVDQNGDGTLTGDDRVLLGNPIPDFTWGMTNSFSYKGFNLDVYVTGVHRVQLLNNTLADSYYPINFRRNKLAEPYLNRWTPENPTNEYPSFINPNAQGTTPVNSKTVEDASYIRLQNVTLGYQIPASWRFVENLTVYVAGNNLFTITDYSGLDPGSNINGNNDSGLRIDYNAYPQARSILFGIKLGL